MTTEETSTPTGVNGSLAFMWTLGIVALVAGVVGFAAGHDWAPWGVGSGALLIALALHAQAIRKS